MTLSDNILIAFGNILGGSDFYIGIFALCFLFVFVALFIKMSDN